MASNSNYYIDTASFSTATAIWIDAALTTKAPDGFYSDTTNYRQQVNGLLQSVVSCTTTPPENTPSISLGSLSCNTSSGGNTVRKRWAISINNAPSQFTIGFGTTINPAGLSFSIVTVSNSRFLEVTFNSSLSYGNEISIILQLKNSAGETVATSSSQTLYGNYQSFMPSCP